MSSVPPPLPGGPPHGGPVPPGWTRPPDHPRAQTVLVLGILGLALCQFLGPFAWSMGNGVVREIDAAGGRIGGRETANIGRVLGIVSTVLLCLGLLLLVGLLGVQLLFVLGGVVAGG